MYNLLITDQKRVRNAVKKPIHQKYIVFILIYQMKQLKRMQEHCKNVLII